MVELLIILPLSARAGYNRAIEDMNTVSSELPRIITLSSSILNINMRKDSCENEYLLFIIDNDFVSVFIPTDKDEADTSVIIKRIPKSAVSILDTTVR